MRIFAIVSVLSLTALASGQTLGVVQVNDLPGTGGHWQTGEVTVAASADEVQGWVTDAERWPQRFPDDEWVRLKGRAPDGRSVVEFRSKALGRALTVRLHEEPGLITYDGSGKDLTTRGKI